MGFRQGSGSGTKTGVLNFILLFCYLTITVFSLRENKQHEIYRLSHFEVYSSVIEITSTLLYNRHHHPSAELVSSCKTETLPTKQ